MVPAPTSEPSFPQTFSAVSDDLERISPRESARNKARDNKARPPKVISVNPGLKKLALHLATKRRTPKAKKG